MEQRTSSLIKLFGLWEKRDKNGNAFFSGSITQETLQRLAQALGQDDKMYVNIFLNKKRKDSEPDFQFYVNSANSVEKTSFEKNRMDKPMPQPIRQYRQQEQPKKTYGNRYSGQEDENF